MTDPFTTYRTTKHASRAKRQDKDKHPDPTKILKLSPTIQDDRAAQKNHWQAKVKEARELWIRHLSRQGANCFIAQIGWRAQGVLATSSALIDILRMLYMGLRGPVGLSSSERSDMWSRWKTGFHVRQIARAFGRDHGSIRNLLLQQGGIAPAARARAVIALTLAEREDVSRGIAADESARAIARRLGRAASTICREISRHGGRTGYRASKADSVA